jgi:ArsR family transcriptional regulator
MRNKRALLEEPSATALAETFRVLGDVTRVRILDAISRSELCVNDIAATVGLSESAVSHQLRLLRGMRVVRSRRAGRMVFYTLDDHHIMRLFEQGLEHVQEGSGAPASPGPARIGLPRVARPAGDHPPDAGRKTRPPRAGAGVAGGSGIRPRSVRTAPSEK